MRALLANPKYPTSYWDLAYALPLLGVRYMQPSLSLLTVGALLPEQWSVRLLDENIEPIADADLAWADVVMLTAMTVQRDSLLELLERCRVCGVRTVVGGPYVTTTFETVPADHIVLGESEDIIPLLVKDLEEDQAKPQYREVSKPSLEKLPPPRYDLIDLDAYSDLEIQFSRGCPFQCDFCEIIPLYGRVVRTKTAAQLVAELENIYMAGFRGDINFVDDNFIANRNAAKQVLPAIAKWQQERGTPFNFYTEVSLDLAGDDELIDLMVNAGFTWVFIGVESPSTDALREARKFVNLRSSQVEAIHHLKERGLLVGAGFILGFDSDGEDIFDQMVEFVEMVGVSIAMVGQLVALPRTPLYDRLEREGRLRDFETADHFGPTNIVTKLPPDVMARGFRLVLERLYEPAAYFARALDGLALVKPRGPYRKLQKRDRLRLLRAGYRRHFWRFILASVLRHPSKMRLAFMQSIFGHHFIQYTRMIVIQRLRTTEARLAKGE